MIKKCFKIIISLLVTFIAMNTSFADNAQSNSSASARSNTQGYAADTANVQPLDGIAATVNNNIIMQSQLDEQVKYFKYQLEQSNTPMPSDDLLRKQVLNQLIDRELQLQQAKAHGLSVDNEELNQAVASIAAQNHITPAKMRKAIKQQGLTYAQYRKNIKEQILLQQIEQMAVRSKIKVSNDEIASYLAAMGNSAKKVTEYHLQGILVPLHEAPTPSQVDAAEQKAENIIKKLKAGADFRKTAIAESAGQLALKGGDMGWRQPAELPPAFAKQIESAQPGAIIGPLQASTGFYVIKYVAKRIVPIRHYTEQYHLRHILIRLDDLTTADDAKARLEMIRKQVLNGASFAKLAEKYSQDPGSAGQGGDIGWVSTTGMPPRYASIVSNLTPGSVSEPFSTQTGWELLQMIAKRRVNDTKSFLKSQVKQYIYKRKYEQAVESWIQQLRGDAYVKIMNA